MPDLPPFSALPLVKSGPPGNAWHLFGKDDNIGMLNLLTPENTASAAKEIQDGGRVSVDLRLGHLKTPCFGRKPLKHEVWRKGDRVVNDDSLEFNTQSSSQWDGFRHFGNQTHEVFFNGKTFKDLEDPEVLGIHSWVENGGVVGRGVLLDYAAWADSQGLSPATFETTSIPTSTLQSIAQHQNVALRKGDILFIRSGYIRAYDALTDGARQNLADMVHPPAIGVESSEESVKWLWEQGFAAVAGDHPSFEAWPPQSKDYCLHEWCLAGWGLTLGELFDLEGLSRECARRKRWSFFFSSMPLRVPGGVASTPNGVAIF